MTSLKYTFYHLSNKIPTGLNSKIVQESLLKWSMKKCLQINYYAFNQEFMLNDIDQFAMNFFQDSNVEKTLRTSFSEFVGSNVSKVQIEQIPCTVTSMTFFDKILDSHNNIVCNHTDKDENCVIRGCMEVYKDGLYINNNLKMMFFEEECKQYFLYKEDERNEFIFLLLKHFVTGGKWCQDDIIIEPYLNVTKCIYKDLITVEKSTNSNIQISSNIYKVLVFDSSGTILFPKYNKESIPYSFAYLSVNLKTRTVALFFHNVGDTIYI